MRRILKICVISLSIILLVFGMKFNKASAQQWEYVPQEIRQLVFEQSRFSQPITFQLPCSDDPSTKERILQKWREPTQPGFPPRGPQNASLINESFLHFLIENKFAKVDKFVMGRGTRYMREYKILSYSDTIKPYIVKGDFENDNFHIILADRTLKSIDYTNEYEATPEGFKIKFFALTFTYTLSDRFLNLPQITKKFKGKARAFLDPDDGKWKLDKFSLEDQDSAEYMTLLKAQYEIFVKKQQEKFIASGLIYRCFDNNVVFFFQFEGGKPPYKYGRLTLNGRTYEEVFGSYIEVQETRFLRLTASKPLYKIYFHQLEKGGGGFTIFISENWPFGWPPDISFPLRVGITIFDSASPQKSAYVETIIDSGPMLSVTKKLLPIYSSGSFFSSDECWAWIEKYGIKLETEDAPKIESSLQKVRFLSPQSGLTLPPGNIPFSWSPVNNATKYQFILYNSQGQVALDTTINSTSLTVALGIEETITWKVRAGDNRGNWGAWSSLWSLTLKSTTVSTESSPQISKTTYFLEKEITFKTFNYKDDYAEYSIKYPDWPNIPKAKYTHPGLKKSLDIGYSKEVRVHIIISQGCDLMDLFKFLREVPEELEKEAMNRGKTIEFYMGSTQIIKDEKNDNGNFMEVLIDLDGEFFKKDKEDINAFLNSSKIHVLFKSM